VSYDIFTALTERPRPYIEKMDTNRRPAITVEHRVAGALYRIAHGASYPRIATRSAVGSSTAEEIYEEIYHVMARHLWKHVIRFPNQYEMHENMALFEEHNNLPMCFGAINGSHIPVCAPRGHAHDYHNRKGFFSIVLQGCVNYAGCFIDINVGCPGRSNDCAVYTASSLGRIFQDEHPTVPSSAYSAAMFGK